MRNEDRLRAHCRMWLNAYLPAPATFTAVEHGIMYGGDKLARAKQAQRLKAQGVKNGIGDIFIFAPGRFFNVELKVGRNTASDAQLEWAQQIQACGFVAQVVRSVSELHAILRSGGIVFDPLAEAEAARHDRELALPTVTPPRRRRVDPLDMAVEL